MVLRREEMATGAGFGLYLSLLHASHLRSFNASNRFTQKVARVEDETTVQEASKSVKF